MITVTDSIALDEGEIELHFVRSSGPGGQHVNKVSTAVQLRFNVVSSPSLPEDVKERLKKLAGNRITKNGVLVLEAAEFRSQEKNRENAVARLVELIQRAAIRPKTRKKTRPTRSSLEKRLEAKRRQSAIKRTRGKGGREEV